MASKKKPPTSVENVPPVEGESKNESIAPPELSKDTEGSAEDMGEVPVLFGHESFAVLLMLLSRELRLDEVMAQFSKDPSQLEELSKKLNRRFDSAMKRRGVCAADLLTGIDSIIQSIAKLV